MDKIWAKLNFWPWPPVARCLQTFALNTSTWKQKLPWYAKCPLKLSRFKFFFCLYNLTRPLKGGFKCHWLRGNNILSVLLYYYFFVSRKNKYINKTSWFVGSTLLCSPRHSRVLFIPQSTTFHGEYYFWL